MEFPPKSLPHIERRSNASPRLLELLRDWWLVCRSRGWLYPSSHESAGRGLNHCGWLTYSPIQAERSAGVIWSPGHPSGYQRTLALMIPTNEVGYFECRIPSVSTPSAR